MTRFLRSLPLLAVALLAAPLAGCETGGTPDAGPRPDVGLLQPDTGPLPGDAGMDDAGPAAVCTPEGMGATVGEACLGDRECDDGCFCNGVERCLAGVCAAGPTVCEASGCASVTCDEDADRCEYENDDSACDDGVFCNGAEVCDGPLGCRPGAPPFCTDGDFCTIDYCDEDAGACVFEPTDADGDGYAGSTCGGLDCDDDDPALSPDQTEICGNGLDDDCNGSVDLADTVCQPTNDRCVAGDDGRGPLDITPTGNGTFTFPSTTLGMDEDYDPTCTLSSEVGPDAVFRFTLAAPKDVVFRVLGLGAEASIALRTLEDCEDDDDLRCGHPTSDTPTVGVDDLAAGDYAVIVETEDGPSSFELEMTVADSGGAQSDSCEVPNLLEIGGGGTFTGTLLEGRASDTVEIDCRGTTTDYPDAVFQLTIPDGEARDVVLRGQTFNDGDARRAWLTAVDACDDDTDGMELGCAVAPANGELAGLTLRNLEGGTYFVVLESSSTVDTSWELDVDVSPASGRNDADSCDADTPLALDDGPVTVDLATIVPGPDTVEFCGANRSPSYRDLFFQLTLDEEQDVVFETDATFRHWAGVSSTCGDVELDRLCFYAPVGTATRRYLRLPAGTHFLSVSTLATSGSITATATAMSPTPVPDNTTCDMATPIADGASVTLDMSAYTHAQALCSGDAETYDAYYSFTLTEPRFVNVRADGAASVALLDMCPSSTVQCDAGAPPRIERVLEPGTYTIAVLEPAASAGSVTLRYSTTAP